MQTLRSAVAMVLALGLAFAPATVLAGEEKEEGSHSQHRHGTSARGDEKTVQKEEKKAAQSAPVTNGTTGQAPGLAADDEEQEEGSH